MGGSLFLPFASGLSILWDGRLLSSGDEVIAHRVIAFATGDSPAEHALEGIFASGDSDVAGHLFGEANLGGFGPPAVVEEPCEVKLLGVEHRGDEKVLLIGVGGRFGARVGAVGVHPQGDCAVLKKRFVDGLGGDLPGHGDRAGGAPWNIGSPSASEGVTIDGGTADFGGGLLTAFEFEADLDASLAGIWEGEGVVVVSDVLQRFVGGGGCVGCG